MKPSGELWCVWLVYCLAISHRDDLIYAWGPRPGAAVGTIWQLSISFFQCYQITVGRAEHDF